MSWRIWKTITFSSGKPNSHRGSNAPAKVSALFPEGSGFCVRISSLDAPVCVKGELASPWSTLERDAKAALARDSFSWPLFRGALCGFPRDSRWPQGELGVRPRAPMEFGWVLLSPALQTAAMLPGLHSRLRGEIYSHLAPGPWLSLKDMACRVDLYQKWNERGAEAIGDK